MQIEICPKTGKEHIQGVFTLKKRARPITEMGFPDVHYERQRGTDEQAVNYCNKTETRKPGTQPFKRGYPDELELIEDEDLRPEQTAIADKYIIDENKKFERKIHWYWDTKGGWGKSILAKYLVDQMGAIILAGANKDCLYGIAQMVQKNGMCPRIVIFDVPRTNEGHISYQAIESIKNGAFFSPKYESGMVRFNSPHIIVFANTEPEYEKLSGDRWVVTELIH